jgi:hypothetical protein
MKNAMSDTWTRRRTLLGAGTVAAGTVGGIAVASNNAAAQVDGTLTVADASVTLVDQTLQDILVDMVAEWSYDSNVRVDSVETEVHTGQRASSTDMIARETTAIDTGDHKSHNGTTELTGSLAEAQDFSVSEMVPETGKVEHSALAELRVFIIHDDEAVAEAVVSDTFTVTISQEEIQVSTNVSGSGTVTFEME